MTSTWLEGSCHCGRVGIRVLADIADDDRVEVLDCNCSVCAKKGYLHLIVSRDRFELVRGAEHLETYTFNTGVAKHTFCRHCGCAPFYTPRSHPDGVDVNARCLDGLGDDRVRIVPFDGRDWAANVDRIR
jgi:hypothetical protein